MSNLHKFFLIIMIFQPSKVLRTEMALDAQNLPRASGFHAAIETGYENNRWLDKSSEGCVTEKLCANGRDVRNTSA